MIFVLLSCVRNLSSTLLRLIVLHKLGTTERISLLVIYCLICIDGCVGVKVGIFRVGCVGCIGCVGDDDIVCLCD